MYCKVGWFDENLGGGSVMERFRVVVHAVLRFKSWYNGFVRTRRMDMLKNGLVIV
jgi:hypothetical protein